MNLTLEEALQHTNRAGRGSLRSLDTLLREIIQAEVGTELGFLNGAVAGTAAASKVVVLDSSGDVDIPGEVEFDGNVAATAGVGITGTADFYKTTVIKIGDIIYTSILIDVDGLNSSAAADLIGADGAGVCHLGQITAALNGTILGGVMTCLQAATGGEPDIDLYCAEEATGVEDTAISALTNDQLLDANADWTAGMKKVLSAMPPADEYLYLVGSGAGTDATYTAGIFLIELYGYDA